MATIEDYRFGHIVIDGTEHERDVIILPDRVVANWWRKEGHGLALEDFDDVIDELPDHLVVGCGAYGRLKPDPRTINQLEDRGIKVDIMPTKDAVGRYADLDPATTAAALHLTC